MIGKSHVSVSGFAYAMGRCLRTKWCSIHVSTYVWHRQTQTTNHYAPCKTEGKNAANHIFRWAKQTTVEKTHATKTMPTLGADFVAMLVIVHCSCEVVSFLKSCCVQCICKVQQYTVCSHKPSGIKFKQLLRFNLWRTFRMKSCSVRAHGKKPQGAASCAHPSPKSTTLSIEIFQN